MIYNINQYKKTHIWHRITLAYEDIKRATIYAPCSRDREKHRHIGDILKPPNWTSRGEKYSIRDKNALDGINRLDNSE